MTITTHILRLTWIVGIIAVLISVVFGTEYFKLVKPIFHVLLLTYYWCTMKKLNVLLVVFLSSTMIAEFLAATNFTVYFNWIGLLFALYFLAGVCLLYPVLKVTKASFMGTDKLATLLVIFILGYVIINVFITSAQELKEYIIFGIATIIFSVFIGTCLFISAFHKNPKKLYLFIVGVGYVVICVGSLVYELQFKTVYLLGLVNLSEIIAQISFVYFLIHRDELLQKQNWFL